MDFIHLRNIGDHNIYNFDKNKHKFLEYFQELYNCDNLEKLGLNNDEFNRDDLCDIETSFHKKFYNDIKTNEKFKKIYCDMIKDIYDNFFHHEKAIIYQSFPSVRFQFINNIYIVS